MSAGRPVVVFGIGDFARVAEVYLRLDSPMDVVAFTVDREYVSTSELGGLPVIPFEDLMTTHPPRDVDMFVAIGFMGVNRARAQVYDRCKSLGYKLISYVNSQATFWGDIAMGDNCFIFEDNVIQPNVRLGSDVILWSGNHIGHDSAIGDHSFIASHVVISGNVTVGSHCFIGVNATLRDGITVAPHCLIGAGALIMRDTNEGEVYSVRGTQASETRSWDLNF
jgi:sugar O-acyltransferase (sialic acid O-acetyltransferase NeuD family)